MTMLRMPDGRQLHYLDIGNGPVLVLLHGWAMSSRIFAGMVEALSGDFRLLVPDLPGHGDSDPGTDYGLNALVVDIGYWFKALGLDRFNLLGWSLGGQIAMQLAADNTLPITRMVVASSTPKFCQATDWQNGLPETQVRAMQRQYRRDSAATLAEFNQMMFAGEQSAVAHAELVHEQTNLPDPNAGAQTLATLKTADIRRRLPEIKVPTLVHHGRADTIIPASAGEYLAEHIPAAKLVVWDAVGHAPFLSRPEDSQELWREFLQ